MLIAAWPIKKSQGGWGEWNRRIVNRNVVAARNNPQRGIRYGAVDAYRNFNGEKAVAITVHNERSSSEIHIVVVVAQGVELRNEFPNLRVTAFCTLSIHRLHFLRHGGKRSPAQDGPCLIRKMGSRAN